MFVMASNEELTLSSKQEQYLEWLCTVPSERQPRTKKDFAELVSVDVKTLRRWEKKQVFRDRWQSHVDELQGSPERTQRLLDTLYDRALGGDVKSAQLYLQATNRMAPPTVTVTSKKSADLSDDELDALIVAVAERERDSRAKLRAV
jgi:hypothetical protein